MHALAADKAIIIVVNGGISGTKAHVTIGDYSAAEAEEQREEEERQERAEEELQENKDVIGAPGGAREDEYTETRRTCVTHGGVRWIQLTPPTNPN
jgi:F0F1-type ATP synthase epsilon subunit